MNIFNRDSHRKRRGVPLTNLLSENFMKRLDRDGLTEEEFLAQYHPGDFSRPSVSAIG